MQSRKDSTWLAGGWMSSLAGWLVGWLVGWMAELTVDELTA